MDYEIKSEFLDEEYTENTHIKREEDDNQCNSVERLQEIIKVNVVKVKRKQYAEGIENFDADELNANHPSLSRGNSENSNQDSEVSNIVSSPSLYHIHQLHYRTSSTNDCSSTSHCFPKLDIQHKRYKDTLSDPKIKIQYNMMGKKVEIYCENDDQEFLKLADAIAADCFNKNQCPKSTLRLDCPDLKSTSRLDCPEPKSTSRLDCPIPKSTSRLDCPGPKSKSRLNCSSPKSKSRVNCPVPKSTSRLYSLDPDYRHIRKKQLQNLNAAKRYRVRKKNKTMELSKELEELESINLKLRKDYSGLLKSKKLLIKYFPKIFANISIDNKQFPSKYFDIAAFLKNSIDHSQQGFSESLSGPFNAEEFIQSFMTDICQTSV